MSTVYIYTFLVITDLSNAEIKCNSQNLSFSFYKEYFKNILTINFFKKQEMFQKHIYGP